MAGTYEHVTLQDVIDQLAQDLGDAGKTFFVQTELDTSIRESYRLWNVLTAHDRTEVQFTTTAGTAWYDLSGATPLLANTITDRSIVETLQYRLMEEIDPADGTGMKEQFAFTEIVRTLQQQRDQFIAETECEITRRSEVLVNAGTNRYYLDDTVIRVLRASWRTTDGTYHPLRGSSDEATVAAIPRKGSIPKTYTVAAAPNLALDLHPVPEADGYLELFTIETGVELDTTANSNTGTVLGIHDDLAWSLGWATIESLFVKNGIGSTPARADVAARLHNLCTEMARSLPTILDVEIAGRKLRIELIAALDRNQYAWEGRNRSVPRIAGVIGNWIALAPVPDDTYDVTVTIVRKSNQPATVTDYLPIGREYLPGILAWSKQLALFKVGGRPLSIAVEGAGKLIEQARLYNNTRIQQSQYLVEMFSLGTDVPVPFPRAARPNVDVEDPRDTASSRNRRGQNANYQPGLVRLGR